MSDELLQTVYHAPLVRPARVRAARARVAAGDWPAPVQVADALLAGWFLHLMLHR